MNRSPAAKAAEEKQAGYGTAEAVPLRKKAQILSFSAACKARRFHRN
jgi:hypothetical protein